MPKKSRAEEQALVDLNALNDAETYLDHFTGLRKNVAERARLLAEKRAALDKEIADAKAEIETRQKSLEVALEDTFEAEVRDDRDKLLALTPLQPEEAMNPPTLRAAYSDRTCRLMAKLSFLAYIEFERDKVRPVLEQSLAGAGLELLATYSIGTTQAYLAAAPNYCVVAFRGTSDRDDMKLNLRAGIHKVQIEGHKKRVRVHAGFYAAYMAVDAALRKDLTEKLDGRPLYLTGHSLGGACALVASASLGGAVHEGMQIGDLLAAVYTFGSPRVGDRDFEVVVKAPHYRVVNQRDIVPWTPPNFLSYRHSGDIRLLQTNGARPLKRNPMTLTFFMVLAGLLFYPFRGRSSGLDDHKITRYIKRLNAIADVREEWK